MNNITDFFSKIRIIPVITIDSPDDSILLADALTAGGLPCAEVTFRTAAAPRVIRLMAERTEVLVGAGSVLNVHQAELAAGCGAKFMVSPGLNTEVVQYCLRYRIPVIPGVCTPTEMTRALELELSLLKFFPAEALGGLTTLKAMSAPFPMLKFIPTGGINANNIKSYLAFKQVLACGGSWMVKKELLKQRNFREIRRLVSEVISNIGEVQDE